MSGHTQARRDALRCRSLISRAGETSSATRDHTYAIVLNVRKSSMKMLNEGSRAFLRHAFGVYYRDVVEVAMHGTIFRWEITFSDAIKSFHKAIMRHCHGIRLLHTHRKYTNLTNQISQTDRARFSPFLEILSEGEYKVSREFETARKAAEDAATTRLANT